MTADEIRNKQDECAAVIEASARIDRANMLIGALQARMLSEIAAQLAETNEYLKRLAYPLMEVKSAKESEEH